MSTTHDADRIWQKAMFSANEVCNNTQIAEDAACHAFNYVMSNLDKWDGRPVENWVSIIARNKALTLKRGLSRFADFEVHESHLTTETPDAADHSRLQTALRSLKPREVEVIVQHYYDDVELRVIAEQNNESVSAVKVRLMRARNKLKDLL
jgi:RNA polymerase sigma factor (sigma-70 family)